MKEISITSRPILSKSVEDDFLVNDFTKKIVLKMYNKKRDVNFFIKPFFTKILGFTKT